MKKFTPGESEVTLAKAVVKWYVVDTNIDVKPITMPQYGETYKVKEYTRNIPLRGWFITLEGIGRDDLDIEVPERFFEEVMSSEALYSQIDDYL
jgi:hypothetical protein